MPKVTTEERATYTPIVKPVAFKAALIRPNARQRKALDRPCSPPPGLFAAYDAISEDVASEALQYIQQEQFTGYFGKVRPRCTGPNRRAIFGNQPSAHRPRATPTLEAPLLRLYKEAVKHLPSFTPAVEPDACTVNVYPTGTGVAAHNDGARFCNEVVGVTLHCNPIKPSAMRFRHNALAYTLQTPHASVYVMSGEAYTLWTHERLKVSKGGDVVSFTFRSNKK